MLVLGIMPDTVRGRLLSELNNRAAVHKAPLPSPKGEWSEAEPRQSMLPNKSTKILIYLVTVLYVYMTLLMPSGLAKRAGRRRIITVTVLLQELGRSGTKPNGSHHRVISSRQPRGPGKTTTSSRSRLLLV